MLVSLGSNVKNVGIDLLLLTSSGKVLSKIPSLSHHLATTPAMSVTTGSRPLIPLPAEEAGEVYHRCTVSLLAVFP